MKPVEVYVECEVLKVRLQLAPASVASDLETLVLRALDNRADSRPDPGSTSEVNTAQELANLFGLTPRLMIDLIGDLWRDQRVTIDFGASPERISLTDKARAELRGLGPDGRLDSSLRAVETQQVLLETLTGRVLPIGSARQSPRYRLLTVPRTPADKQVTDIERSELTSAVQENLRRGDDRPPFRVLEAHLLPNPAGIGKPIQYLQIDVNVAIDEIGRLMVRVEDRALSRAAQEEATRRLQRLIEDQPTHIFAQKLREQAEPLIDKPVSLDSQFLALTKRIDHLSLTSPDNRQAEHDRAAAVFANLASQIGATAARQMHVHILRSTAEHQKQIIAMLESAREQIIIAVPWIRYNGISPYLDAIRTAVTNGVQVVILWGIDRDRGSLDAAVLNALDGIERDARMRNSVGSVRFDRTMPSHVHAKLVVVDDRSALVTSKNFFSNSDFAEFGVAVSAIDEQICPAVEDLIRWARDATPSSSVAQGLVTTRALFGERKVAEIPLPVPPRLSPNVLTAEWESGPLTVWAAAWEAAARALEASATQSLPSVQLITDGLHRSLMWDALRSAVYRVIISSDQLSADVVTDDFIESVRKCLERGVDVLLLYRRHPVQDAARSADQVAALEGAVVSDDPQRGKLQIRQDADTHAKVLVADNSVVIGSYNYLSFEATYRSGRRRQRSEVSLKFESASFADGVTHLLSPDYRMPSLTTEAEASLGTTSDALIANDVVSELENPRRLDSAKEISALCRSGDTEFAIVDLLASSGIEDRTLLRIEAATVAGLRTDSATFDTWCERILRSLWESRDWAGAHLMRACIASTGLRPRHTLTVAAACLGSADAARRLEEAAYADSLSQTEAIAICVASSASYILTADQDFLEPIELLRGMLPDPISQFVDTATDLIAAYGEIPWEALANALRFSATKDASESAWESLSATLGRFRQAQSSCIQEQQTKTHLLNADGKLGILAAAVNLQDSAAVAAWLGDNADNPGQWLDRATRESGARHLIQGRSRKAMMSKLGDIFRAAQSVTHTSQKLDMATMLPAGMLDGIQQVKARAKEAYLHLPSNHESSLPAAILNDLSEDLLTAAGNREVFRHRPDAWRFPTLFIADLFDNPSPKDRAATAALDIYLDWSAPAAVNTLIEGGEFLAAGDVIDQVGAAGASTEESISGLRDAFDRAREDLLEELLSSRRQLILRADRAGIDLRVPEVDELSEALDMRTKSARELLHTSLVQLKAYEESLRSELYNQLDSAGDSFDQALYRHIKALIAAGEFRLAHQALSSGDVGHLSPLHVEEQLWRWPFRSLKQIAQQLANSLARPPGMEIFVPNPDDKAGSQLVAAITQLASNDDDNVKNYIAAVQGLVARVDSPARLERKEEALYAKLILPDSPRLPQLSFVGRAGTEVAVGAVAGEAKIRLSLEISEQGRTTGHAVVDIASVLSLLAKDRNGNTRNRSDRCIGLLRTICTQLEFEDVIAVEALDFQGTDELRPRLWWLLYLLSLVQGPGLVDAILELSGGHARPLWELLRREVSGARKSRSAFSLERMRQSADDVCVDTIACDLDDDQAAAVLFVIAGYGVSDEQGIRDGVVTILQQLESQISVDGIIDIDLCLERLHNRKYLHKSTADQWKLCGCGMIRALQRTDPLSQAQTVIARLVATHEADRNRRARDRLHRRAAVGYLHQLGRSASGVDPRADIEINRRTTELEDEWLPSRAVDVYEQAAAVCQRCRLKNGSVDVLLLPAENPSAKVFMPPLALVIFLENILDNAIEAAAIRADSGENAGTVYVEVTVQSDKSTVSIDVHDSGPGIPPSVRADLASGETPVSTKHSGCGVGLIEAVEAVRDYDGTLTVMEEPSKLGGAHFRAMLPLHAG